MYVLTESDISTYLHFGYLPDPAIRFLDLFNEWPKIEVNLRIEKESPPKLLVEQGVTLLRKVFRDIVAGTLENHILALSGGIDSRAILGGLLENVDPHQIQTVTFGSPGTRDFELGKQVARSAGVHWQPLDLSAESWKWETKRLLGTAMLTERPVWAFDACVNRSIVDRFGTKHIYWSGFMGNPLDGDHLFKVDSASWEDAKRRFVVKNTFSKSLKLTPPNFAPDSCLPAAPFTDPSLICFDEQIDFGIRQYCMVRHTILPTGYEYRTPFLHPEWVSFILGIPRRYRVDRWLYKEILRTAYPRLFSLPLKTNFGLPLGAPMYAVTVARAVLQAKNRARRLLPTLPWGVRLHANYIDFNEGLRKRNDLKNVVYENLQDMKKRNIVPWLDMNAIWLHHQQRDANHADALTLLASLEIYLKAQEGQN